MNALRENKTLANISELDLAGVRQNSLSFLLFKTSKTGHFVGVRNKSSDTYISVHAGNALPSCFGTGHVTVLSDGVLLGQSWFSDFRVRGARQNSHLKQAKLGTFEYSSDCCMNCEKKHSPIAKKNNKE